MEDRDFNSFKRNPFQQPKFLDTLAQDTLTRVQMSGTKSKQLFWQPYLAVASVACLLLIGTYFAVDTTQTPSTQVNTLTVEEVVSKMSDAELQEQLAFIEAELIYVELEN